jgi:hypothetical protein
LAITATWQSHYPIQRVDVLWNGQVIATQNWPEGVRTGQLTTSLRVPADGWVAARVASQVRDSFFQPVYAHTSPVYVETGQRALEQPEAAAYFDRAIDTALEWVNHKGRYRNDSQRREVVELFQAGQAVYQKMTG